MEITVSVEPTNVEEGTITFNVSKEWLAENNIDKNSVKLMKYVNGKWIPLETRIIGENERYVYYEAKTPGFSVYAITGGETETTPTTTTFVTTTTVTTTLTTLTTTATATRITSTPTSATPTIATTIPTTTTAVITAKKTPGFGIIAGSVAIGVTALILRKRRI